jgi:ribosome maturation factor RimP
MRAGEAYLQFAVFLGTGYAVPAFLRAFADDYKELYVENCARLSQGFSPLL